LLFSLIVPLPVLRLAQHHLVVDPLLQHLCERASLLLRLDVVGSKILVYPLLRSDSRLTEIIVKAPLAETFFFEI